MAFAFRKTGIVIVTQRTGSRSPTMLVSYKRDQYIKDWCHENKKSVPPHLCRSRCCSVPALLDAEVQPLGQTLHAHTGPGHGRHFTA